MPKLGTIYAHLIWGFPNIRGTLLGGGSVIRIIVFWGLYWETTILTATKSERERLKFWYDSYD